MQGYNELIMRAVYALVVVPLLSFAAWPAIAQETSVTIEDRDLKKLQPVISSAVISNPSFSDYSNFRCSLIGKKISLSKSIMTFFVTTENACGWGAALGPMWIVESKANGNAMVILNYGGYSLEARPSYSNGMPEIEIRSGTAATYQMNKFYYDGRYYRLTPP